MRLTRRCFVSALAAILLLALPAQAAEWRIAFQAVPDGGEAVYTKQAARTAAVISELGPPILSAVGLDPTAFDADVVAGGYRGRIAPTVVMPVDGDRTVANRLAAACGIVFDQASVLEWRDDPAASGFAVDVEFATLTPTLTEFFFRQAIAVNRGLAGGFTARDNRLLFINLRGADGRPASGLDDEQFAAALRTAARSFGGLATVRPLHVEAHLVTGEDGAFAAAVGASALPGLDKLRTRRAALVAAPY